MKTVLGYGLFGAWLLSVIAAFWWFEYRHWRDFDDETVVFQAQDIAELYQRFDHLRETAESRPLVVHFRNTSCPCYRYQKTHIDSLQTKLKGISQVFIDPGELWADVDVPATPSVAIWDQYGELAYFGPYSSGSFCGEGDDFVSLVISELRAQRNPAWINTIGIGCYCSWNASFP